MIRFRLCTTVKFFFLRFTYFIFRRWWVFVAAFVAAHGLSLVVISRGYSSLQGGGLLIVAASLLQSMASRHAGFRSCSAWAQKLQLAGSRTQAQ